jgi:hypothetical protein
MTIEIYHKHKLKRGVELVLKEPNSGIQTLSHAQLLQANGQ